MTLQELKTELFSLSPDDKLEVIQILAESLWEKWPGIERVIEILDQSLPDQWLEISKTPEIMGGDACIGKTRIPIWLLVIYRRLGASDADLLQDYPYLSASDLTNAFAYADAHSDEIEIAIKRQRGF